MIYTYSTKNNMCTYIIMLLAIKPKLHGFRYVVICATLECLGHEKIKPVPVSAGLGLTDIKVDEIDWQQTILPAGLARLVEDDG